MGNREKRQKREQFKRMVLFVLCLLLVAALTALFGYVWYDRYSNTIVSPFFRKGNWVVIGIYGVLLFAFAQIYGGFKVGFLKQGNVLYSLCLSILFVNVVTYFQVSLIGRHLMETMPFIYLTLADIAVCMLWVMFSSHIYQWLYPPRQMLLIFGSDMGSNLVEKVNARREKYHICETISAEESVEMLEEKILHYESVIICDVKAELRNRLLKFCFSNSVRVYITPKISDVILRGADDINLFDIPLVLCRNNGLTFEQRLAKRIMDLLLSSIALVLASPFMLITALVIKLYDHGPVLYKQVRLTEGGREFEIYKFRSMRVDAEKETGAILAGKEDDRITPVGKIIRAIRFDELPQIINILKGDMSIVGPRPERPELAKEHEKSMPEFSFRLKVKAGLTGYAQILGRYNTLPYDKLKFDLMYISRYSLLLDIKLILMTIKILFMKDSTEGVDYEKEEKKDAASKR
ncbi:MAG: sugar transferase [Oscillospiraceae bacterium]|nr:sugar transferase [Oscillospiraceae bacterium]